MRNARVRSQKSAENAFDGIVSGDVRYALHCLKSCYESLNEVVQRLYSLSDLKEFELQELDHDQAKRKILAYIKEHHGVKSSELVERLQIVPWQVGEILDELQKEKKVKPIDVE